MKKQLFLSLLIPFLGFLGSIIANQLFLSLIFTAIFVVVVQLNKQNIYKQENKKNDSGKTSENEDGDDFLFLVSKLVVYTAKYCGNDKLGKATQNKIKDLYAYKIKNIQKLADKYADLYKLIELAKYVEVSKDDLYSLCEKIKTKNTYRDSWHSNMQNKILGILFSAVYQNPKCDPQKCDSILREISDRLKIIEYLFNEKKSEYDKKQEREQQSNSWRSKKKQKEENDSEDENHDYKSDSETFVSLTLELLVEAMKVDRSKMVCELDVVKAFILKYDKEHFQERVLEVKKYLGYEYVDLNVDEACKRINKQYRQNYTRREEIFRVLVEIVYADETCNNAELQFLKKVAKLLKVSKGSYDFMRSQYENRKKKKEKEQKKKDKENKQRSNNHSQGNNGQDHSQSNNKNSQGNSQPRYSSELEKAYAALGVDRDATDKEIKASWRNLMRVNHPDLMESKGADAVRKANEKCQEINKAFEVVKASRGMK